MSSIILTALSAFLTPMSILVVILGAILGMFFGVVPGLGAVVGIAILIPFSLLLDQQLGLLFLMGTLGGVNFAASISAILLNVPGTAPALITAIDGHPMARDGRAKDAIAASATASALGAIIGFIFLLIALPLFGQIMLFVGPPEFFIVSVIGLGLVAYVVKGSILRSLIGLGIGFTLAFHGFNPITGGVRFGFGNLYLFDGIQLVVLVVGLYGVGEMIHLGARNQTIDQRLNPKSGSVLRGITQTIQNRATVVRSSLIGITVGVVPAAGALVSMLAAYTTTKNLADDDDSFNFGRGDIRGVISAESANDAKDAGALIPTVFFAIPGSPAYAVLLAGLLVHGLTPGPRLMTNNPSIVYVLIFGLVLSNIATSLIGVSLVGQLTKVTRLPAPIIVSIVIPLSVFGVFAFRQLPMDILVMFLFGILGYQLKHFDVSRVMVIFAFVLGPIVENTFIQTLQIAAGDVWVIISRPAFSGIIVFLILVPTTYVVITRLNFDR